MTDEDYEAEAGGTADPDNYTLEGEAINNNRSWRMSLTFRSGYCIRGACQDTDRIVQRWTIDPNRNSTRFSFNSLYSPKSDNPHFANIWSTGGSYTARGVRIGDRDIGRSGSQSGSGSGDPYVDHEFDAESLSIQGLVRTRARNRIINRVQYERIRTGRASCPERQTGNWDCRY